MKHPSYRDTNTSQNKRSEELHQGEVFISHPPKLQLPKSAMKTWHAAGWYRSKHHAYSKGTRLWQKLLIRPDYLGLAAAAAKSLHSCLNLYDPRDGNPLGSLVPGILQARTLEWVAISFSSARKWKVKVKSLSRVRLLETPWTAAYQAPPPMRFSKQEYWSGVVPLPSPKILADQTKRHLIKEVRSHIQETQGD